MSEDNLQIEVPADELEALGEFETARAEIYKSTHAGDTEREQRLTELAGSMATRERYADSGQPISVLDRALDIATSGDAVAQAHLDGPRYRLSLGPDGHIADVSFIKPLAENPHITARAHRIADHIGWGHKQNSSSFRTQLDKVDRIRTHI